MMELEVPCKQKDKDKEEQEAPFSLSKKLPQAQEKLNASGTPELGPFPKQ